MKLSDFEFFDFQSQSYGGELIKIEPGLIGASICSMSTRGFVAFKYGYIFDDLVKCKAEITNAKNDNEIIRIICNYYLRKFSSFNFAEVDNSSIFSIKQLAYRIINFINNKDIEIIDKYRFIKDDSLVYILVSVKEPEFNKIVEETIDYIDFNKYEDKIKNFEIYNPRLDKSYKCNFEDNIVFDKEKKLERQSLINQKIEEEKEFHNKISQAIEDDGHITDYEFNAMCREAIEINPELDEKTICKQVNNIKRVLNCSLKDAFDQFLEDLTFGINHNQHEILYDGLIYKNRTELIKKVFHTRKDIKKINGSISQRMRYHNISLEEAVNMTLKDKETPKYVVYKRKKYPSKKALIDNLFPARTYTSVMNSIDAYQKNHNCTFEQAIDNILSLDKNLNRGFSKEVIYDGITYKSLRSACKALGLKPEKISRISKQFGGDYAQAIDYELNQNK